MESLTSSPDPLGISDENMILTPSPSKRRASSITPRKPLGQTSGNSTVQEFYISTPTKSNSKSKAGQYTSSPWRLRMTLEANPLDAWQNPEELDDQTVVTKIPLKGGDDSSPIDSNRGRGGSRKSLGSPIRRTGTPKPRLNRRKTMPEPADAIEDIRIRETSPFARPGDAFPKRRPRKSVSPGKARSHFTPEVEKAPPSDVESRQKRSRSRKRRTEITPMKLPRDFEDDSDVAMQPPESPCRRHFERTSNVEVMNDIGVDQGALETDDEAQVDDMEVSLVRPSVTQDGNHQENTADPTEEHHDFDTILESEGFSMVSMETLSSTGNSLKSPTEQTGGIKLSLPTRQVDENTSGSTLQQGIAHGYSDISSSIVSAASPMKITPDVVHGYSDISSSIVSAASPNKASHEVVHGYSDISSSIVSAASPTKTSHLAPHLPNATPKSLPSFLQSVHDNSGISSKPRVAPTGSRVSQLRRKAKGPRSSRSPSLLQNTPEQPDNSPIASDRRPGGIETQQKGQENTPTNRIPPSVPMKPIAAQSSSSSRPLEEAQDGSSKIDRIKRAGSALQDLPVPTQHSTQQSDRLGSPLQISQRLLSVNAGHAVKEQMLNTKDDGTPSSGDRRGKILQKAETDGRQISAGPTPEKVPAKRRKVSTSPNQTKQSTNRHQNTMVRPVNQARSPDSVPDAVDDSSKQDVSQTNIIYPSLANHQLPSPAESSLDDEDISQSLRSETGVQSAVLSLPLKSSNDKNATGVQGTSIIDDMMMAREAEWQREREAVSRQIQMANTSQVIVIDSDVSNNASMSDVSDSFDGFTSELGTPAIKIEQKSQISDLFLQAGSDKPQQSVQAKSKDQSRISYNSDRSLQSNQSDLFWQPDHSRTEAAKRRQERRKNAKTSLRESSSLVGSEQSIEIERKTVEVTPKAAATRSSTATSSRNQTSPVRSDSAPEERKHRLQHPSHSSTKLPKEDSTQEETVLLDSFSESSLVDEDPDSYRSVDTTQDTAKPELISSENKTPRTSSHQGKDDVNDDDEDEDEYETWTASPKALTHIDPELIRPSHTTTTTTTFTTAQPPTSPKSWLSTLSSLLTLTPQPPPPIPWYNSPHPTLPPATLSDILASSPHTPLSPYFPWTLAHTHALHPLYHASRLFGSHIFAYNPSSAAAGFEGEVFTTPLGWGRGVGRGDVVVVGAFMMLLEMRGRGYARADRKGGGRGEGGEGKGEGKMDGHQYGRTKGERIDPEFVLRKSVEAWVDLVMCGDVPAPAPVPAPVSAPGQGEGGMEGKEAGEAKVVERIGLRRRGDRLWRPGSWWDLERERSRSGYFERKRRGWGGLPSWRKAGLV